MKIHILYPFVDGPWGGANQFLKAVKNVFKLKNVYTENIKKADVILINSHHSLIKSFFYKYIFPNKIFIHRIDGPINLGRKNGYLLDNIIYKFNDMVCDGTIFQSNFSKNENILLGFKSDKNIVTIYNAPDKNIFFWQKERSKLKGKIKVVITSWSANMKKGFMDYKWMDENLDFNKFEVTFIGNSPLEFKNIKLLKPLNSKELSVELLNYDIFMTASRSDPCSNALIEALHLGLPALVYNDGGHPELVRNHGETYNSVTEIENKINFIFNNSNLYGNKLDTIDEISEKYYSFIVSVQNNKQVNLLNLLDFSISFGAYKLISKYKFMRSKND